MDRKALKYIITAQQPGYTLLDMRGKKPYHVKGHIINTLCADLTGDDANARANLEKALDDAGENDIFVLIDDGSGVPATRGTQLLTDLGIPASRIDRLEGGYAAWLADDAYGHFQHLIDLADEADRFTSPLFRNQRPGDLHISPEEMKAMIEDGSIKDRYILDSRTVQEWEEGHFAGSVPAPTFAFYDDAGFVSKAQAIENIQAAFAKQSYIPGTKLILVCRGGRGGAQLLADVLREDFEIDSNLIYILTYGYDVFPQSWMNLGAEYTRHILSGTL